MFSSFHSIEEFEVARKLIKHIYAVATFYPAHSHA